MERKNRSIPVVWSWQNPSYIELFLFAVFQVLI